MRSYTKMPLRSFHLISQLSMFWRCYVKIACGKNTIKCVHFKLNIIFTTTLVFEWININYLTQKKEEKTNLNESVSIAFFCLRDLEKKLLTRNSIKTDSSKKEVTLRFLSKCICSGRHTNDFKVSAFVHILSFT